jgi:Arc/MetJ family transcription regulator
LGLLTARATAAAWPLIQQWSQRHIATVGQLLPIAPQFVGVVAAQAHRDVFPGPCSIPGGWGARSERLPATRTNIDLDDEIVEQAMRLYGTRSKRETVDLALRRLVGARLGTDEALALEGSGWEGDLDAVRRDGSPESG